MISRIKTWARTLRRDAHAIFLASRDPRVPWAVKLLALAVAAYAFSPIDLIPDFIPVLGYLDDLVIVPFGIWLVIALIPGDVMNECRAIASAAVHRPGGKAAAIAIVALWISGAAALSWIALIRWI
ncbi:YkvA family protein [uncultured Bradyrhizobium sp.]|uniref:YkvA family protein n=1 Tax=uncultured Bradyrhizobium sp. TaxID=199684 RepID=UPI0035C9631E